MKQIVVFLLVLVVVMVTSQTSVPVCENWAICKYAKCARPDPCPWDQPYLIYSECGCCTSCSSQPTCGPCGTCGVDVICKESEPICSDGQITTLDYCGCCKVCMDLLGAGEACTNPSDGPYFAVCDDGLTCTAGICQ